MGEETKLIKQAIAAFAEAYKNGDLDTVVAYYAEDLIKLRNGYAAETKSETSKRLSDVFNNYNGIVDVIVDEIQVQNNFAFTRGSFAVTLTPTKGGQTTRIERRYLEIWRKDSGKWRVIRTMDNV
jgi:ketosteroid isomerase-like protein